MVGFTHAFDPRVRALECARCSATLITPREGGRVDCTACGTPHEVTPRVDEPLRVRDATPEAAQARLDRLRARLAQRMPDPAYDLAPPPPGFTADPSRDAASADALRSAWNAARPTLSRASVTKQRDALWLALRLADVHVAKGAALLARALLETALEALADAGHRHLLRCRLATLDLWESDVEGAALWLAGVDLAPEAVELDSALREIEARLAFARGDYASVLTTVGRGPRDVPIAPGFERATSVLRIQALGGLGEEDLAYEELRRVQAALHDLTIAGELGPDDRAVKRHHREVLLREAADRDAIPTGAAAVFGEMVNLPVLAIAVLGLVMLPRWFFDADPFGGAHGYLLCPEVCAECRGPLRLDTPARREGSSQLLRGTEYYCATPTNEAATLSETELAQARARLAPYRLSFAPGALTYLSLLLLLLPVSLATGVREHFVGLSLRRAVAPALAELAAAAGTPPPSPRPAPAGPVLVKAATRFLVAALVALGLVALELGVHRLGK